MGVAHRWDMKRLQRSSGAKVTTNICWFYKKFHHPMLLPDERMIFTIELGKAYLKFKVENKMYWLFPIAYCLLPSCIGCSLLTAHLYWLFSSVYRLPSTVFCLLSSPPSAKKYEKLHPHLHSLLHKFYPCAALQFFCIMLNPDQYLHIYL